MAALARQGWPDNAGKPGPWPRAFRNSRRWCFLTMRPGAEPIKALVEVFLDTWQFEAADPARINRRDEWIKLLLADSEPRLPDLLDETERRYKELNQSKPLAYLIYLDQGEELYARAEERQRRRFSEIIALGLSDPRLRALMSMRTDFLGELHKDEPLFGAHMPINVPPLREAQLREVIERPTELLSARFESDQLALDLANRTAEDSTKDAGALPAIRQSASFATNARKRLRPSAAPSAISNAREQRTVPHSSVAKAQRIRGAYLEPMD